MPGYSGTPLIQKLGIKDGMKVMPVHEPKEYSALLGKDITHQLTNKTDQADLVHFFAETQKDLEQVFPKIISRSKDSLIIWISWYKKTSGIKTDVTENSIRDLVLKTGWVDVKVCAVSDLWSGLKIVKRKKLRDNPGI